MSEYCENVLASVLHLWTISISIQHRLKSLRTLGIWRRCTVVRICEGGGTILTHAPRSLQWPVVLQYSRPKKLCVFLVPHVCYMSCPLPFPCLSFLAYCRSRNLFLKGPCWYIVPATCLAHHILQRGVQLLRNSLSASQQQPAASHLWHRKPFNWCVMARGAMTGK
jgi:hypothetical protein